MSDSITRKEAEEALDHIEAENARLREENAQLQKMHRGSGLWAELARLRAALTEVALLKTVPHQSATVEQRLDAAVNLARRALEGSSDDLPR